MPLDSSCRRFTILRPSPATVPLFAIAVSIIISSSSTDAGCLASLSIFRSALASTSSFRAVRRPSKPYRRPRLVSCAPFPPSYRHSTSVPIAPPHQSVAARLSPRLARHPRNRITRTDQTSPTEEDKTETKREPSHDQRRQNNQLNWSADERDTAFLCSFCNYMSRAAKTTLAGSIVASGLTVWAVHFMQTQERAVSWVAKMVREGIESNRGD